MLKMYVLDIASTNSLGIQPVNGYPIYPRLPDWLDSPGPLASLLLVSFVVRTNYASWRDCPIPLVSLLLANCDPRTNYASWRDCPIPAVSPLRPVGYEAQSSRRLEDLPSSGGISPGFPPTVRTSKFERVPSSIGIFPSKRLPQGTGFPGVQGLPTPRVSLRTNSFDLDAGFSDLKGCPALLVSFRPNAP